MILPKQKLVLILSIVVFLISAFFIGKGIPVAYGASVGGLIFAPEGYFMADNSVFGGPQCGVCLAGYWRYYSCGTVKKPKTCKEWVCTLRRMGIGGTFTADSACKAAYGWGVSARVTYLRNSSTQINICDFTASKVYIVECTAPPAPTPTVPPAPPPPCLEWKDGVCIKIGTSIFHGGDKDKGNIAAEPAQLITIIFTIILGFAGGIALLLIISAGYKIIMSKGKPEAIAQGREQLISAIVGLIFIIFSFIILQLVFVDILKIPGIF